jgi:SAM-dependent methyltransferase
MLISILYLILFLVATVCLIVSLLIGASVISLFAVKVPFVPTPKKNVKLIINQLNLKPGQVFYDLGCGDGRFLIEAAKRGAKAIGFDVDLWAYIRCRINILINKCSARVYYKNFYHQDLSKADAVFCFLITKVMPRVEAKLKTELKTGAVIVCYGFNLPTLPAEKIVDLKPFDKKASKIYVYKI